MNQNSKKYGNNRLVAVLVTVLIALFPAGCNLSFHDIGIPPKLSKVNTQIAVPSTVLMPEAKPTFAPKRTKMADNSLWNKRNSIYFRDTRAFETGDILTVSITMNDSAKFNNRSKRDTAIAGSLGGAGTYTLPSGFSPSASIDGTLKSKLDAERGGTVNRSENIRLQVAAVVVAASENGNLRIIGSQEVRVNAELRILTVEGIVRSKDIQSDNTITYDKIAEARISYGGNNTRARRSTRQLASRQPTTIYFVDK